MSRGTSASWVGVSVNPRQAELFAVQRWIPSQQFLFGRPLFEHRAGLVHADSCAPDTGLATPNLRVFDDHLAGAIEEDQFRPDFLDDVLEVQREPAKQRKHALSLSAPVTVGDNRVVHEPIPPPPGSVTVERRDGVVRVEVEDGGHGRAVVCAPSTDALAGRGLRIVDSIAAHWGDGPCPNGYAVWFELRHPSPPANGYARPSGGGP